MEQLVELGLKRPRTRETDTIIFVDNMLGVLADVTPEAEPEELEKFRTSLGRYRQDFKAAADRFDLLKVTEACLATCEQYLRRSQRYHTERGNELTDLIRFLRDASTVLVGEASEFNTRVLTSAEKFGSLAQMEDLRGLKQELSVEVTALRTAVAEKQERDERKRSELSERVATLETLLSQAELEAALDPLTNVANRRSFDRALQRTMASTRRSGTPMTLAMLDIDHFKRINDQHGHLTGDRVLVCVAQWLGKTVRHTDFVARYGGEEFAVIFTDAKQSQVESRMRDLLRQIGETNFQYESEGATHVVTFTASVGVAELASHDTGEDLVRRADEALYDAKRAGRNRVVGKKRSLIGQLLGRH